MMNTGKTKTFRPGYKVTITAVCAAIAGACALLAGCAGKEVVELPVVADYELTEDSGGPRTNLKVGVVPGPYGDMFMEAVYPSLKEKGYTVELIYYDDYTGPNYSLAGGQIDLNIFQHYLYLINSKFENDLDLSAITEIPTVSMGIYSSKYSSLDEMDAGITVSLPDDSTNFARALMVLEDAGLLVLDPSIDKTKAQAGDIRSNPRFVKLVPLQAHELAQTLGDYGMSVINGNYAISGGLDLSDALYAERLGSYYFNVIAVRTEDLGEQFVRDIIKTVRSEEFRAVITDTDGIYAGFQRPLNFYENID